MRLQSGESIKFGLRGGHGTLECSLRSPAPSDVLRNLRQVDGLAQGGHCIHLLLDGCRQFACMIRRRKLVELVSGCQQVRVGLREIGRVQLGIERAPFLDRQVREGDRPMRIAIRTPDSIEGAEIGARERGHNCD